MAGKLKAQDLQGLPLGYDTFVQVFPALAGMKWAPTYQGESSEMVDYAARPLAEQWDQLAGYTFDWDKTGYGGTGTLNAYNPDGSSAGQFSQKDESPAKSLTNAALLAGGMFGGLGLAGMGPLSGLGGMFSPAAGGVGGVGNAMFGALEGLGTIGADLGGGGMLELAGLGGGADGLASSIAGIGGTPTYALTPEMVSMGMPSVGGAGGGNLLSSILGSAGDALGGIGSKIGGAIGNMGGMDWLKLGGNLLSAGLQSRGLGKAADLQAGAARDANELLRTIYAQNREDMAPYRQAGYGALGKQMDLLGLSGNASAPGYGSMLQGFTGADVATEPGYQFGLAQGNQALERAANAAGRQYSGATLKALQRYGQDYAGTKFDQAFNRDAATKNRMWNMLGGVSGAGQNATGQVATMGQQTMGQMGQNLMAGSNAGAAAALGRGNLLADLLNQGLSSWRRGNGGWAGIGTPSSPEGWY